MTKSFSWRQLIHYGEVVGFLVAWAIGIVATLGMQPPADEQREAEGMTIVSSRR